jgi:predicted GNAT family acetyltransferase
MNIRPAQPEEAELLSALGYRAKAHWGYDEAFMKACWKLMGLTNNYVRAHPVYVLEEKGKATGFYVLSERAPHEIELMHMFVEPALICTGCGRSLWEHAIKKSQQLGYRQMYIESDPNAEGFYLRMGAERIGDAPSAIVPGRMLPLLRFKLG